MQRTIRFRITALSTAAIGIVLLAAVGALMALQSSQLNAAIDDTLRTEANAVAEGGTIDLSRRLSSATMVQVVADGTVIDASVELGGLGPIAPAPAALESVTETLMPFDDDPFRVLSRRLPSAGGEVILHVAVNSEDVGASARALVGASLVLLPVVALAMAFLIWWMVGRTLQPVEEIRSEVAAIGGERGHRVPEPSVDDEIGRLARTMNEMLDRIDHAIDRQQRFVADASHELRTPLTRIRTELEVTAAEADDRDAAAVLDSVLEETIAMQRLVEDLLLLARADAGELEPRRVPVDLDDLALIAADSLRTRATVAVDTSGVGAAQAQGDEAQFGRVISNLVDNAERHASSTVWLRTYEDDGYGCVAVANDGPPIPEAHQGVIFERFGRIDEARSASRGGTGLGLAIVREIVERHGGEVDVRSDDSMTEFIVRLPGGE